ncbi:MAG: hypothetical protein ACERKZ_07250 [Lachnotalea sp.]
MKKNEISEGIDSDEVFAFIAGYTSGGVPYGITWEEMQRIEELEEADSKSCEIVGSPIDEELPFK